MRKFTLFILVTFIAPVMMAQTTFNWVAESLSPGNNLRQMHLYEDQTAVIVGQSTFLKYNPTDKTWNDKKFFEPVFDYTDLSIKNGTGIVSARRSKIIDNPSGGNDDIYTNGIVLKTTDHGATWTTFDISNLANIPYDTLNPIGAGSQAADIFSNEYIDENNIILYSGWTDYRPETKKTRGAVFATTDGGLNWTALTGDLGSAFVTGIENIGTTNYICGNSILLKHTTGSTTTTDLFPTLATVAADQTIYINDLYIVDENTFYVLTVANGIYKTTDGGTNFTLVAGTPSGAYDFYIHNADVMVSIGLTSKSVITTDGGSTWNSFSPGATIYEIGGIFNGYFYVLGKSMAYKVPVADLETGTNNWSAEVISQDNTLQKMYIADDNTAFIAGSDNTLFITTDGGASWEAAERPTIVPPIVDEIDFNTLSTADGYSMAAVRRFKLIDYPSDSPYSDLTVDGIIFVSDDNWETWSIFDITDVGETASEDATLNPNLDNCYGTDPYRLAITNDSTYYIWENWYEVISAEDSENHSRVFKTDDKGETWKAITDNTGYYFVNDIEFLNKDFGIIGGNSILLKTTDGGETFTDLFPTLAIGTDGSLFVKDVTIVNENEFYVTTSADGVFKTTNGGADFTMFNNVAGGNDFIRLNNSTYMILGLTTKSYYTNDGGTNWENCSPGAVIWDIGPIMNDSVYALAKEYVFKIAVSEIATSTGTTQLDPENEISVRYLTESIDLVSSQSNIEQCLLYSITGELVATYNPNALNCKIYTATLPSGIYIAATTVTSGKRFINKLRIR